MTEAIAEAICHSHFVKPPSRLELPPMSIYLFERFPEMRPVSKPPSLFTINGVGTTVYGARDFDEESGTYVKTLCFTFVFLPIFCLGAYRVADAQNGW